MIDRLERDPEAPPSDALAEAIVLRGLLYRPEQLAHYDPSLLLVFPEHRIMHAWMRQAYAATHNQEWGYFYIAWLEECERQRPGLSKLLDGIDDDQARLTDGNPWDRHDFVWWWQRLKDCAEARRLVSVAQAMAESAWRGDLDAARTIAGKAVPRPPTPAVPVWEREAL